MSNLHPRTARSRAAILDTAWMLICDQGLEVRMADIADAVGMTRQSIYLHFKTRGGLLAALVHRADEREAIHARLATALAERQPEERLAVFLTTWLDFVPQIYPVARQLIAARADDPDARNAWQGRMRELRSGFGLLTRSLRRDSVLAADWTAPKAADYLWSNASVQAWELLAIECGWGQNKTARVLKRTLATTVLK